MAANDRFFGKNDQGAVSEELLTRLIEHLPEGVTEVGLHPAVRMPGGPHGLPQDWQPERELAALTSPALRRTVETQGVELCRWADIA
ncbi:YdjC-like protein [compost metagenome]